VLRGLGWSEARWRPGPPGLTRASKWLVAGPSEAVFVKVGDTEQARGQVRAEIGFFRKVAEPFMPSLLGWNLGDPPFLVLEDLSHASWPPPYPQDVGGLIDLVVAIGELSAPVGLRRFTEPQPLWPGLAGHLEQIAATGGCSVDWLRGALPVLAAAEARVSLTGDRLVHGDLFFANICFAARGPVIVDWTFAGAGSPEISLASLRQDLLAHGIGAPVPGLRDEGAWAAFLTALTAQEAVGPVAPWISDEAGMRELHRLYLPAGLRWAAQALRLPAPRRERAGGVHPPANAPLFSRQRGHPPADAPGSGPPR
jgi:hypothetical protein